MTRAEYCAQQRIIGIAMVACWQHLLVNRQVLLIGAIYLRRNIANGSWISRL
ncbi:MAG TPA: hypothetical protein VF920_03570 [Dongiaceae bacterium]